VERAAWLGLAFVRAVQCVRYTRKLPGFGPQAWAKRPVDGLLVLAAVSFGVG
jgi:hypothetical protein